MALRRAVQHRTRAGANGRILLGGLAVVPGAALLAACGVFRGPGQGTRASVPDLLPTGFPAALTIFGVAALIAAALALAAFRQEVAVRASAAR